MNHCGSKGEEESGAEKEPVVAPNNRAASSGNVRDQDENRAREEILELIRLTRPKNFVDGLGSGVSHIVGAALGGAGLAVINPLLGLEEGLTKGYQGGGVPGGVLVGFMGGIAGAVTGAVGGAAVVAGGAAAGATQIVRGVVAEPEALIQPRLGRHWDEFEHIWIVVNLEEEVAKLAGIPADDDDILGKKRLQTSGEKVSKEKVMDDLYYDALGIEKSETDQGRLKQRYYVQARKYHPDHADPNDTQSARTFRLVSEAYSVLSDKELRSTYNGGLAGINRSRRTSTAVLRDMGSCSQAEPLRMYAHLFGSDKFEPYVGTLAVATSASIGDVDLDLKDSRTIQRRRCIRLAHQLVNRLEPFIRSCLVAANENNLSSAKKTITAYWKAEANELVKATYGSELLRLIGQVYVVSSMQFLGMLDSGIGMPSISRWANSAYARLKRKVMESTTTAHAGLANLHEYLVNKIGQYELKRADTFPEYKAAQKRVQRKRVAARLLSDWTTTVVDITNTLHETCQLAFFDVSVASSIRRKRGEVVKIQGEVFINVAENYQDEERQNDVKERNKDSEYASKLYETAAYAAILETVMRKEDEVHHASREGNFDDHQ